MVFVGDSITDCGRREDAGPLGRGYVKFFADMALIREPEKKITIHNRGINGDRVNSGLAHIPNSGLINRWQTDVLDLRPDWLSIMIGINDITSNFTPDVTPVTPEIYARTYDELLARTRASLPECRLVLMESFFMCNNAALLENEPLQGVPELLPEYLATVHRLSRKYKARLVKTQEAFRKLIAVRGASAFGDEPIHPNATGHLVIAETVYRALSS